MNTGEKESAPLQATETGEWGKPADDHFGYASDEERRAKRGMEDWELVEKIGESQEGVPLWFVGIIITVLLVAIGLSFPFWGDRPDMPREWVNWGFVAALFYIGAAAGLVYFMVQLYGSRIGGKLDSDEENKHEK
ncbi:MAG: hypothetical protein LBE50_04205 [Gallionellaceae bacterium]|jgi:hypothetical protein|nr:hypothetical protein [Gallionellaceae bacterium]